ncbi:sex comb on midleg-like protein 1 [Tupaia chinensis]|uniref:sex comb on midleg-like protein 1 n=1 Tax=Tupaia chinensis TaxID=246437 RepID=UPI0003C8F28F|nr:sex comb on midleg-like protein 1 [Tupaia chinensis]
MSSISSEADVIKTRISTYEEEEDDNTVLYAYEPNAKYINKQESVLSDASYNDEQQSTIMDVLNYCQVIYNAIQNLDKKFDVIHGKVSKIHRLRVKSFWQSRKPLGYAFKNYNYLLAKKMRYRKMKKREAMSSFSYPESYSPTTPVGRREIDSQSNNEETSYQSQEYQEPEQSSPHREFERPTPTQSPLPASFFPSQGYQPYFTSDDVVPGTSAVSCFASPGAHSGSSMLSCARSVPSAILTQEESDLAQNPETENYPAIVENKHILSSFHIPQNFGFVFFPPVEAPSFIAVPDPSVLKQGFSKDPSTWSVEEVIQFMRHTDPQISGPLADLFRQHDIDGKALLLLKNDMMMQYMGLKLGTVVKLSHYVDKLKEKHFNF